MMTIVAIMMTKKDDANNDAMNINKKTMGQ